MMKKPVIHNPSSERFAKLLRASLRIAAVTALAQVSMAQAATITAASCNLSAVQTAVNQAAAGDTVRIPAGTCSWGNYLSWNPPPNVSLIGAGNLSTLGGGDATVIIDDAATGAPLLDITTSSGTFRLAGITVRGGRGSIKEGGMIYVGGGSKQVRIDHNHIDKSTYSPQNSGKFLVIGGTVAGVVDQNLISAGSRIGWIHIVNGGGTGDPAWAAPTNFGGSDFIFLENNRMVGLPDPGMNPPAFTATLTDCHTGGRYVARYNNIVGGAVGQTHPTGHAGHDRGCRAHELYGNVVTSPVDWRTQQPNYAFEYNNSGVALVWGNSFDQVYKNIFVLNITRKDNGTYGSTPTPYGWGYCGTQFNGTGSRWDGNTDGVSGYPCLDQPGRGQGDMLSGDFPNQINNRTGTISWPNQKLEPLYEWLNVGTITPGWGGGYMSNQAPTRIVANRDYYLYTSSFNGTSGVGSGPRSSRPSSCTAGVAYWSTDQGGNWNTSNSSANDGTLDICTSTNSWTNAAYTPYTFPHPLAQGQTTPPPASLVPPANLTVR
jgi:hypothetical protein